MSEETMSLEVQNILNKLEEQKDKYGGTVCLESELKTRLLKGDMLIDFNGHFAKPEEPVSLLSVGDHWAVQYFLDRIFDTLMLFNLQFPEDCDVESSALKREHLINSHNYPDVVSRLSRVSCLSGCGECGEDIGFVIKNNVVIAVSSSKEAGWGTKKCKHSGGVGDFFVELDVPSGKLVFDNDLRSLLPDFDPDANVNQTIGTKKYSKAYSEQGLGLIYVGNTCPSIFRNPDDYNHLMVGQMDYDTETGEYTEYAKNKIGSICTDLWWYSVMDYDNYVRLGGTESTAHRTSDIEFVEVVAGRYSVSSRYHNHRLDKTNNDLYSEIKRIGDVDAF